MRAVTFSEYGRPEVLRLSELATPTPGPGQVLIRVTATEVTKSDCELRAMQFPVKWFAVPLRLFWGWRKPRRHVLGAYFAGEVVALGTGVTHWRVGDEVYGSSGMGFGAHAEYVVVPESGTYASKPRTLSFAQAAALPLGGLNALHFMTRACIRPGERVLVIGAGGSIGSYALQLAKRQGAHVTAVDAAHKFAWLRDLGADELVDYTTTDALAEPARYDVIFATVAGERYTRCLRALKARGRYLTANPRFAELWRWMVTHVTSDKRVVVAFADESRAQLDALRDLVDAGELRVPIDRTYTLAEAPAAHARVESEQRLGAVVLDCSAPA